MVAAVALDPSDQVSDAGVTATGAQGPPAGTPAGAGPAPLLVSRPIGASGPTPPVRGSEAVAEIHRRWAALAGGPKRPAVGGVLGRVRRGVQARVRRLARLGGAGGPSDLDLLGSLVRAVDALAARHDELAARVDNLEGALEEVVRAVSEDLVQLRATQVGAAGPIGVSAETSGTGDEPTPPPGVSAETSGAARPSRGGPDQGG